MTDLEQSESTDTSDQSNELATDDEAGCSTAGYKWLWGCSSGGWAARAGGGGGWGGAVVGRGVGCGRSLCGSGRRSYRSRGSWGSRSCRGSRGGARGGASGGISAGGKPELGDLVFSWFASDDVNVDLITLVSLAGGWTLGLCVKVVEQLGTIVWVVRVATEALVEDGAARVCKRVVLADGEALRGKSTAL